MNPYISNPELIPETDRYADVPFYGRYHPSLNDFRVDMQHVGSTSEESLQYWSTVLKLCTDSNMIYPADEGRDVFALGSIIVKSSHRHETVKFDYSYSDANEVQAIKLAKGVLTDVRVPEIYFAGKIEGRAVLIQERLAGVGLNVAAPYLSEAQKTSFKLQAREILRQLQTVKAPSDRQSRDYIVPNPNILSSEHLNPREVHIIFSANINSDLSFMHNDFTPSNCIVHDDKITGLIDWEMAGYLGWKTAGQIHRDIRTPRREQFVNAKISEERLKGIMWWNDLYDDVLIQ